MQTRSQTRKIQEVRPVVVPPLLDERPRQKFEVNIDFDDASRAWKENKVYIGNGSYKYVCCQRTITNKVCSRKCLPGEDYCRNHLRMARQI